MPEWRIRVDSAYPVRDPSPLERLLFDQGLVQTVPLAHIYDIKARTTVQRAWQHRDVVGQRPNVDDPAAWDAKLHASPRGEFFVAALQDCARVLDLGCGEGWPTLYLARHIPRVVGLDLSAGHVALARRTARLLRLGNAQFVVANIEALPFPSASFDGVCFGGNVFTYGFDLARMLRRVHHVLRPGGPFAFEQLPASESDAGPWERIGWFIDAGPPILNYDAGSGSYNRGYLIYLRPNSEAGRRMAALHGTAQGERPPESMRVAKEIKQQIQRGALDLVDRVLTSGEGRAPTGLELADLLRRQGFTGLQSWLLPDARVFARGLDEAGTLPRLSGPDLVPCLRALVQSAPRVEGWIAPWATCTKA
jgi:SAM-dependent methyltransferase